MEFKNQLLAADAKIEEYTAAVKKYEDLSANAEDVDVTAEEKAKRSSVRRSAAFCAGIFDSIFEPRWTSDICKNFIKAPPKKLRRLFENAATL